jgi:hypothetical protein
MNDGMSHAADGEGAFGTQLVTQSRRLRPEYVQYARVAKKVDVRRLKEELWRGMGIDDPESVSDNQTPKSKILTNTSYHPKHPVDCQPPKPSPRNGKRAA